MRFDDPTCGDYESKWTNNDDKTTKGHWHAVLFGKNCCGRQTTKNCMNGKHAVCRHEITKRNIPTGQFCICPCHNMKEALGL